MSRTSHLESGSSNVELSAYHRTENSTQNEPDGNIPNLSDNSENISHQLRPVTKQRQIWVLVSAFLTICITIGFNQSYGIFQRAYSSGEGNILPPSQTKNSAAIAFVGTLGAGLTWAGSIVINPLMERVSTARYITISGVILMSLGFGLASLSTQLWHLILTQGLIYGIGSSMLYFPILSVTPEYFDTHRGGAMGIALSGAGIGAVIISTATQALINKVGVRWSLRFLCFLNLLISTPIALKASPSRFISKRQTHVSFSVVKKPAFILSTIAALLQSSGNLIPLTFLSEFSVVLGYSAGFGAALIAINNGVNSASRVLTGIAGDKFGRQNILILTVLGSAIVVAGFWLGSVTSGSHALWILFVVFYGIWAGGYNALFPTTIAEVFGVQAYASVNGFMYFVRGLGSLFGSPVAGLLMGESTRSNYLKVVYFDTALLFGASACIIGVRYFDSLEKGTFKLKA